MTAHRTALVHGVVQLQRITVGIVVQAVSLVSWIVRVFGLAVLWWTLVVYVVVIQLARTAMGL